MPDGMRCILKVVLAVWMVCPALLPPFARTTTWARAASASVNLPLPSSPHCPPMMMVAGIPILPADENGGAHRNWVTAMEPCAYELYPSRRLVTVAANLAAAGRGYVRPATVWWAA